LPTLKYLKKHWNKKIVSGSLLSCLVEVSQNAFFGKDIVEEV